MAVKVQHLRSSTASKRPTTAALLDGEVSLNTNAGTPGLFIKDSAGSAILKIGPAEVGSSAPNATPASGGSAGNTTGEMWLDTANAGGNSQRALKIYDGTAWRSAGFVTIGSTNVEIGAAATTAITGLTTLTAASLNATSDIDLENQADLRFFEATGSGSNYVGFQAPASIAADVLWTLPSTDATVAGQVLSSNAAGTLSWATISTNSISQGNSSVTVTDSGSNGNIAFATEGATAWNINSSGHLVPGTDSTYNIGASGTEVSNIWVDTLTSQTAANFNGSANFSVTNNVTAGTNAQGQGALTKDLNVITTAAANPSGVTLPTATAGRRVYVVNKGANPVNVYPATGAAIDALAANASIQVGVDSVVEFNASSTTQWYTTVNSQVNLAEVTGILAPANGGTGVANTGTITLGGNFTTSGAFTTTLTVTGNTNVTLPTSGTLVNTAVTSLSSLATVGTITSGTWSSGLDAETFSVTANVTAGTNAQGQGALTKDFNVVTTAAANPSGITLPTATTGRRVYIVNRGANPVNVYPATGGTIDALAANASIQIPANGTMFFWASSATQWYSSSFLSTSNGSVSSFSAGTTGLTPSTATTGAVTLAGTLSVANGGTGQTTYTNGQLLIGNTTGNTLTKATLTQGTGISITNGAGSITLAVAASVPTSVSGDSGTATPSANSFTISGGTGITSSGAGSTITIALDNTAVTAASYGSATQVATFTVDQQGRLTAAANQSIQIATSQVTSFDTQVRTSRLDQMAAPTAPVSFNSQRITDVATPLLPTDAANKAYADSIAQSLNVHGACDYATTGAVSYTYVSGGTLLTITTITGTDTITFSANHGLSINSQIRTGTTTTGTGLVADTTYYVTSIPATNQVKVSSTYGGANAVLTNGTGLSVGVTGDPGVGATLTGCPNTVDSGSTLTTGQRILVKDHTTAAYNGVYSVTTVGTGANGVWTRGTDMDNGPTGEISAGDYVFIASGTVNGSNGFVQTASSPIRMGKSGAGYTTFTGDSINFSQFSGAGQITAGLGLSKTGNTLDVVADSRASGTKTIAIVSDEVRIDSAWTGQTSLTTLGTISTGTWNGTAIGLAYGGTGQSNTSVARYYAFMGPNNAAGNASFREILTSDIAPNTGGSFDAGTY